MTLIERVRAIVPGALTDEPLSRHATFGIGGPAAVFAVVDTPARAAALVQLAARERVPLVVVGGGSNILFRGEGYDGIVMKLGGSCADILWSADGDPTGTVVAGGGAPLSRLVAEAGGRGYSGLAGCAGIPGTVGGAVAGNAGTRDGWIGAVVAGVDVITAAGGVEHRGRDLLWFSYRDSSLRDAVILTAFLSLKKCGKNDSVIEDMRAAVERRKTTQPLGARSAGCVFKNPPGESAGRLIDACGLKGASCGGARVSDVHANFIVNTGAATAQDVLDLAARVRDTVKHQRSIDLELEINIIP